MAMKHHGIGFAGALTALLVVHADAQTAKGPFARIAILRPHDVRTVDFEAGYVRHLEWHKQARDPWVWYGWTVWAGVRGACALDCPDTCAWIVGVKGGVPIALRSDPHHVRVEKAG